MATVVAFHAHPDDEAILTGGTLARAADDGHRVVLVVATDGRVSNDDVERLGELRSSAQILGVHRVECLGYADSGFGPEFYPDPRGRVRFGRADTERAAEQLAAILRGEGADLLLSYQPNGGYGHRDHVQVHHVGKRAAELAATPRVLEATMPRESLLWVARAARLLRLPAPTRSTWPAPRTPRRRRSRTGSTCFGSRVRSAMRSQPIVPRSAAMRRQHGCSRCCYDFPRSWPV